METMAWTDERLEERFNGIDLRFDRVERQIETSRTELKGEISVLQAGLNRIWISMVAGLFGVIAAMCGAIAAILVKGG